MQFKVVIKVKECSSAILFLRKAICLVPQKLTLIQKKKAQHNESVKLRQLITGMLAAMQRDLIENVSNVKKLDLKVQELINMSGELLCLKAH